MQDTQISDAARLIESEARYRAYIDNASDMIQSVAMDGSFEFVNRAWLNKLEYTEDELSGLIIWDIIHPSSIAHCQELFMAVMGGQAKDSVTAVFAKKDGTAVPVEGDAVPRIVDGKVVATHSFFRDVTERLRAEELEKRNAALERENLARYLEKMAALGKLSAGLSHELNNPASAAQRASDQLAAGLAKRDDATRALATAGTSSDDWAALAGLLDPAKRPQSSEKLGPLEISEREESMEAWLDDHGIARAWELSPRLVRVGINEAALEGVIDPLPAAAATPAINWIAESAGVLELTDVIGRSASRISELVAAVKSYSHMDRATELIVDVHDGIEDTLVILGHRLTDVSVRRSYDRSLPPVRALGNSLNQVWTNIIDNAIDATEGKGTLTITTRRDGDRAIVELGDDGRGISPEDLNCIFEPFYTTKPQGQGTGLGLDTAWRIVTEEHQGMIEVESWPGHTVFKVSLPLAS